MWPERTSGARSKPQANAGKNASHPAIHRPNLCCGVSWQPPDPPSRSRAVAGAVVNFAKCKPSRPNHKPRFPPQAASGASNPSKGGREERGRGAFSLTDDRSVNAAWPKKPPVPFLPLFPAPIDCRLGRAGPTGGLGVDGPHCAGENVSSAFRPARPTFPGIDAEKGGPRSASPSSNCNRESNRLPRAEIPSNAPLDPAYGTSRRFDWGPNVN